MNEGEMDRADVRHLIGGYASGSLTADERRRLFEAALDDQELFDALQNEQALKELLDDPVSREQVRRAAVASLPQPRPRRAWAWSLAASVGAAAMLTMVLFNWHRTAPTTERVARTQSPTAPRAQPAPSPVVPPPEPPQRHRERVAKRDSATRSASLPPSAAPRNEIADSRTAPPLAPTTEPSNAPAAPVPPAAVTEQSPRASPGVIGGALTSAPAAGFGPQRTLAAAPQAPAPVTDIVATVAKRIPNGTYMNLPASALQPGDVVRLTLFPRLPGTLIVLESDASDPAWKTLFPVAGPSLQLPAGENYAVPLEITVTPGKLLRVIVGAATAEIELGPKPQQ